MLLDVSSAALDALRTMKQRIFFFAVAAIVISSLSSCLPLAAGAAAGYIAHEEGYRVQSPVTKE